MGWHGSAWFPVVLVPESCQAGRGRSRKSGICRGGKGEGGEEKKMKIGGKKGRGGRGWCWV